MKTSDFLSDELDTITSALDPKKLRGKRFLVTGGAGFLGSWICDVLISCGSNVDCLDNLSSGRTDNIDHLRGNSSFRFLNANIAEEQPRGKGYDVIVHLASPASPEEYQLHPIQTLLANSAGTRNVLELAKKYNATLLFASTSEVYGDPDIFPTPETYWGWVNPVGVRSCYDEGKRFGEALCFAYAREHAIDVRIARIFNTYGPRMRADGAYGRVVPRFIRQALDGPEITVYGDGSQTRSFCYFTDTVAGLLLMVTSAAAKREILNIGSSEEVTVLELAKKIRSAVKSETGITYRHMPADDPKRRLPDVTMAKKILNWESKVSLDSGLRRTIRWFTSRESSDLTNAANRNNINAVGRKGK